MSGLSTTKTQWQNIQECNWMCLSTVCLLQSANLIRRGTFKVLKSSNKMLLASDAKVFDTYERKPCPSGLTAATMAGCHWPTAQYVQVCRFYFFLFCQLEERNELIIIKGHMHTNETSSPPQCSPRYLAWSMHMVCLRLQFGDRIPNKYRFSKIHKNGGGHNHVRLFRRLLITTARLPTYKATPNFLDHHSRGSWLARICTHATTRTARSWLCNPMWFWVFWWRNLQQSEATRVQSVWINIREA